MAAAPETQSELRFACTRCGACCNRSPEVQLSEAAALADVFVFRLMFRLYALPGAGSGEEYYQSKRLLAAFAARKYAARRKAGHVSYLTISALTLDTRAGACAALAGGRCTIYERRPLACCTVPFHYSRAEASAERALKAFVGTPGYRCDTGASAPVVLAAGRIVDPEARRARSAAMDLAGRDRRWQQAILGRLKSGSGNLPSLGEIEAAAPFGATTVSMRIAWQIAAEAGLMGAEECRTLIAAQAAVIGRELASARCPARARETLAEMRGEYLERPAR